MSRPTGYYAVKIKTDKYNRPLRRDIDGDWEVMYYEDEGNYWDSIANDEGFKEEKMLDIRPLREFLEV